MYKTGCRWDECHKKCTIGELGVQAEHHIKFRRDKNHKLDLVNGTYDKTEVHRVNVTYEQEVRQSFGCATTITTENGVDKQIGKRAKSFDYSGKTIVSIKVEKQNIRNKTERVRMLSSGGTWVYDPWGKVPSLRKSERLQSQVLAPLWKKGSKHLAS